MAGLFSNLEAGGLKCFDSALTLQSQELQQHSMVPTKNVSDDSTTRVTPWQAHSRSLTPDY